MSNRLSTTRRIAALTAALVFVLGLFAGTGLAEAPDACPHHTCTEECTVDGVCTFVCDECATQGNETDTENQPSADITYEEDTDGIATDNPENNEADSGAAAPAPPVVPDLTPEDGTGSDSEEPVDMDVRTYAELAQRVAAGEIYVTLSTGFAQSATDAFVPFAVPEGIAVTIDLNGQHLEVSAQGPAVSVSRQASLTVVDSAGSASVTVKRADSMFQVEEDAELAILNGTYCLEDDAVRAVTVNGGRVTIGTQSNVSLPYITRTKSFSGPLTADGGAVLATGSASVTMLGGAISATTALRGGGVALFEDAQITLSGGSILGCYAEQIGGGIYYGGQQTPPEAVSGAVVTGNLPQDIASAQDSPAITPDGSENEPAEETPEDSVPEDNTEEEPDDPNETEDGGEEAEEDDDEPETEIVVSSSEELWTAVANGSTSIKLGANIAVMSGTPGDAAQKQYGAVARISAIARDAAGDADKEPADTLEGVSLPLQITGRLSLDLNGYELAASAASGEALIELSGESASFELADSASNGKISVSGADSIIRILGGNAFLRAGTLNIGQGTNRGIEAAQNTRVVMTGTLITGEGNAPEYGGGVLLSGGSMELRGQGSYGWIRHTKAENGGGVAVMGGGRLEMSGGSIEGCTATKLGGGIFVSEDSVLQVSGKARVTGNNAAASPKNIWMQSGQYEDIVTDDDGVDIGDGNMDTVSLQTKINEAAETGGTVEVSKAYNLDQELSIPAGSSVTITLTDTGAVIAEAPQSAAIRVAKGASLNLDGSGRLRAEGITAAIAVEDGANLTISGQISIINNGGSHAVLAEQGSVTMNGGTIIGSGSSSSRGGAMFLEGGTHEITGGTLMANHAYEGGAIYLTEGAELTVNGGTIAGNGAARGAGIFVGNGSTVGKTTKLLVKDGSITGNTARDFGGGVYVTASRPGGAATKTIIEEAQVLLNNTPDQVFIESGADAEYGDGGGSELGQMLQDAVRDGGGTVSLETLENPVLISKPISLTSSKPVTIDLDLAGRTVRWIGTEQSDAMIHVQGPIEFRVGTAGKISAELSVGSLIRLTKNTAGAPTLDLTSATLTNPNGNHAIWSEGATVNMGGDAEIVNSGRNTPLSTTEGAPGGSSSSGSAIYADNGSRVTITGGSVVDCGSGWASLENGGFQDAEQKRGAVYVKDSTLNISGGTFTGNQGLQGGAVAIENTTATITGGLFGTVARAFSNGNMASWGGALWIKNSGKPVTVTGAHFGGNTAAEGGAIYIDNGTVNIGNDTTIEYNAAVMGSKMVDNAGATANNWRGAGGGIYAKAGSLNLTGSAVISHNAARGLKEDDVPNWGRAHTWTGSGGGILLHANSTYSNGVETVSGGPQATIAGTVQITGNTASLYGGGIYTVLPSSLAFSGTPAGAKTVDYNTADAKLSPRVNVYARYNKWNDAWNAFTGDDPNSSNQATDESLDEALAEGTLSLDQLDEDGDGTVTLQGSLTLQRDTEIELAGRTLTYSGDAAVGDSAMILVPQGVTLTVRNTAQAESGEEPGLYGTSENGLRSLVRLEGTTSRFVLEGGNLTNAAGHAVYAPNGGTVTIDGAEARITNSGVPSISGGAIMMEGTGLITVQQGTLSDNRGLLGGAIYSTAKPSTGDYSVVLNGGTISGNAASDGGGIWADRLHINGATIANNRAAWGGARSGQGGGVFVHREKESKPEASGETNLLITRGLISGNVAEGVGGGISLSWGTAGEIAGAGPGAVQITGNRALAMAPDSHGVPHVFAGGGIFVEHRAGTLGSTDRYGSLKVRNLLVTNNTASYGGGVGLCADGSLNVLQTEGASIYGNHITGAINKQQLGKQIQADQTVMNASSDILGDCTYAGYVKEISGQMLGSAKASWSGATRDSAQPIAAGSGESVRNLKTFGLTNNSSNPSAGDAQATCIISGNESRTGGGGIGGNGGFTVGFGSTDDVEPLPSSAPHMPTLALSVGKTIEVPEGIAEPAAGAPLTFRFTLEQSADDAHTANIPYRTVEIGPLAPGSDVAGEAKFRSISFTSAGTYNFIIEEDIDGLAPWWTQEGPTEWNVTVEVTETPDGSMDIGRPVYRQADQAGREQYTMASFVNVYRAPDVFEPKVVKHVVDPAHQVEGAEYEFVLAALGDAPMPAGASSADGLRQSYLSGITAGSSASFGQISFTAADLGGQESSVFTYEIREIRPDEPKDGMIYDASVWTVTVDVAMEDDAAVIRNVSYASDSDEAQADAAVFRNIMPAPVDAEWSLDVVKQLEGASVPEDVQHSFRFTLSLEDGNSSAVTLPEEPIEIDLGTELKAVGSFTGIEIREAGTYVFGITEEELHDALWEQSGMRTVTVIVEMDEEGNLAIRDMIYDGIEAGDGEPASGDAALFVNTYKAPDVFEPSAEKELDDPQGIAQDAAFTFELAAKPGTPMPEGAQESDETVSVRAYVTGTGRAVFGEIRYTQAGTYTYTITEIDEDKVAGVVYDNTVWTLNVPVTEQDGVVIVDHEAITYTNEEEEAEMPVFVNRVPVPTATPGPSSTPTPSPSPGPSETPKPSVTPAPSNTPSPGDTPTPSATTPAPSTTPVQSTPPQTSTTPEVSDVPSSSDAPAVPSEGVSIVESIRPPVDMDSSRPTSDTMAGAPDWDDAEDEPEESSTPTSETLPAEPDWDLVEDEPSTVPTSETMAGTPVWPEETAPTSETLPEEPLWPSEQQMPSPGVSTVTSGSSTDMGSSPETARAAGVVPKTDDPSALEFWVVSMWLSLALMAAGTVCAVRIRFIQMRDREDR